MHIQKEFIKAIIQDNFSDFAEIELVEEMADTANYMTCDAGRIFMDFENNQTHVGN